MMVILDNIVIKDNITVNFIKKYCDKMYIQYIL